MTKAIAQNDGIMSVVCYLVVKQRLQNRWGRTTSAVIFTLVRADRVKTVHTTLTYTRTTHNTATLGALCSCAI